METVKVPSNQLLFNLDTRASLSNLKTNFHNPQPIVIEKFDPHSTPAPKSPIQKKPCDLNFSAISEDSLRAAVHLAKRDLKKQKEQQLLKQTSPKKSRPSHGAKVSHLRGQRPQSPRRLSPKRFYEKPVIRSPPTKHRVLPTRSKKAVAPKPDWQNSTPPIPYTNTTVRDPNPYRRPNDSSNQIEKLEKEIQRIRHEMEVGMEQVKHALHIAQTEAQAIRNKQYAEDIEAERRRAMRAEQHTTRSSRSIYQLTQQVSGIQQDLHSVNENNKSQIVAKLAAAHRGSLRVLQTFTHHLADYHLRESMPRCYVELTSLLRQLSNCCNELQLAGVTHGSDSVMKLISEVEAANQAYISESTCPANKYSTPVVSKTRKPLSQKQAHGRPGSGKPPVQKAPQTNFNDRSQALRAGIQSLMSAAESPQRHPPRRKQSSGQRPSRQKQRTVVPPLNLHSQPKRGSQQPKGILMQPKSRKNYVQKTVSVENAGFLESTVASRLKEVDPADLLPIRSRSPSSHHGVRSASPSPSRRARSLTPRQHRDYSPDVLQRSRSLSPRRSGRSLSARSLSARSMSGRSLSARSSSGRLPVEMTPRDIARQVWLDKQAAKEMSNFQKTRQNEKLRLKQLKREVDPEGYWVSEAEHKIRERLEPLLRQAQDISETYEQLCEVETRLVYHLSPERHGPRTCNRSTQDRKRTELNADVLADSILGEVLEDTARHLDEFEDANDVHDYALAMMDTPTLSQIIRRMNEMEKEENEIRRRWATIAYEDERRKTSKFIDAPYSDRPTSPQLLQVIRGSDGRIEEVDIPIPGSQILPRDGEAIMFTKPTLKSVFTREKLELFNSEDHRSKANAIAQIKGVPPIDLYLSPQMIKNIKEHKQKFHKYLKGNDYEVVGRFDPWSVVKEVSDDIVSQCITDVSKELLKINDDIVNNVYQSEFEKVPEGMGLNAPLPPPPYVPSYTLDAHESPYFPTELGLDQERARSLREGINDNQPSQHSHHSLSQKRSQHSDQEKEYSLREKESYSQQSLRERSQQSLKERNSRSQQSLKERDSRSQHSSKERDSRSQNSGQRKNKSASPVSLHTELNSDHSDSIEHHDYSEDFTSVHDAAQSRHSSAPLEVNSEVVDNGESISENNDDSDSRGGGEIIMSFGDDQLSGNSYLTVDEDDNEEEF